MRIVDKIFPQLGGEVLLEDGNIFKYALWTPFRIAYAIAVSFFFYKPRLNTLIVVHRVFNGIGPASQYVNISFLNADHPEEQFWGCNLSLEMARKTAKNINDLCDKLEEVGLK